jgi:RND family efflux transporter MFP subunit
LLATLALGACGQAAPETAKPPVAVEVAEVVTATVEDGVEIVGTLAAKNEATVKPEYRGVIAELMVDEWVPVRKGQPLARLDMREIEAEAGRSRAAVEMAQAQLRLAEAAEGRAQRDLQRLTEIDPYGIVSRQEFDQTTVALESAKAQVAAARAALEAARQAHAQLAAVRHKRVLVAPIDGVVSAVNAKVGDFVSDGAPPGGVFRIVDNRVLELTATAPARDAARLAVGQEIVFTIGTSAGETFTVPLKRLNPAIDPFNRSIRVFAEIENESGALRGGLFVKGRVIVDRRANVLVVPRVALLSLDLAVATGEVLVINGDAAERRTITVGTVTGERVEVRGGLAAGDRVVTVGGSNVREGDRIVVTGGGR